MKELAKKREFTIFSIVISLRELINALINAGIAKGYFLIDSITLNPLTALKYTIEVSEKHVAAIIAFKFSPDPDRLLSLYVTVDSKPFAYDPEMVADTYAEFINFLRDYNFIKYANEKIEITITNTSDTQTAYLNFIFVWAEIPEKEKEKIQRKYFEVIQEWLLKEGATTVGRR